MGRGTFGAQVVDGVNAKDMVAVGEFVVGGRRLALARCLAVDGAEEFAIFFGAGKFEFGVAGIGRFWGAGEIFDFRWCAVDGPFPDRDVGAAAVGVGGAGFKEVLAIVEAVVGHRRLAGLELATIEGTFEIASLVAIAAQRKRGGAIRGHFLGAIGDFEGRRRIVGAFAGTGAAGAEADEKGE